MDVQVAGFKLRQCEIGEGWRSEAMRNLGVNRRQAMKTVWGKLGHTGFEKITAENKTNRNCLIASVRFFMGNDSCMRPASSSVGTLAPKGSLRLSPDVLP